MRSTLLVPVVLLVAAGCARKTETAPNAAATGAPARWTGAFQPQQQRTGGLGPTGSNRAYGNAYLTPTRDNANRARVQLQLTAPVQTGQTLAWGVFPGRCGSGSGLSMPVAPVATLPAMQVMRAGGVQLDQEIAITLPPGGSYHLNVFWGSRASDLSEVMACANLQPQR